MTAPVPLATTDKQVFLDALRPGDVLVFDSLFWVSGLIQFADNRPANHCAMVVGNDRCVDANQSTTQHPRGIVDEVDISYYLGRPSAHSVQAVRPRDLDEDAAARLLDAVAFFRGKAQKFAYLDLFLLAPSAIRRSYGAQLQTGSDNPQLRRLVRMLYGALVLFEAVTHDKIRDDEYILTCSEFVYRTFERAGIPPTITNPLQLAPDDGPWPDDLLALEAERIAEVRAHNALVAASLGLTVPSVGDAVQPDRVTPGDLWNSPSFDPVIQFVVPPRPADQ